MNWCDVSNSWLVLLGPWLFYMLYVKPQAVICLDRDAEGFKYDISDSVNINKVLKVI